MKRVYFITDIDLAESGGQSVHVIQLAKNLAKRSLDVTLYYPAPSGTTISIPKEVRRVPIRVPSRGYLRGRLFQVRLFLKLLNAAKPDILYIRLSAGAIAPILYARLLKVPSFVEINGNLKAEYRSRFGRQMMGKHFIKLWRIRWVESLNLRWSSGVIFVDEQLKEEYIESYKIKGRTTVIHNGADVEVFKPIQKEKARNMVGLSTKELLIGYTGALAPWYAIDDLIQAVSILIADGLTVRLVVVGAGSETLRLKTLTKNLNLESHVLFTGAVPFSKIPFYLNAFDILALPLRSKGGSPIKLYEYLACGRPVVGTRVSQLQIIEEIGAGVLTEANSPESLAQAIMMLIHRRDEWETMGERGRAYVKANATWSHVAERTISFIKQSLRG